MRESNTPIEVRRDRFKMASLPEDEGRSSAFQHSTRQSPILWLLQSSHRPWRTVSLRKIGHCICKLRSAQRESVCYVCVLLREDAPERLAVNPDVRYVGAHELLHGEKAAVRAGQIDRQVKSRLPGLLGSPRAVHAGGDVDRELRSSETRDPQVSVCNKAETSHET